MSSQSPAVERAIAWLTWMLSRGPVLAVVVEELAKQHGQDWLAVEEAKEALGVEAVQLGPGESWSWQMPTRVKVPE